ncbi:MAG: RNase adapter RapZ [Rugosibacter sp.]
MKVVLISGLSGSGKSIALKALEDAAYYCVDNLPAPLLSDLVRHLCMTGEEQLAVAIDMRGGSSIATLPPQLKQLEMEGFQLQLIFLDTRTDILIQRFSETRRRHPMARNNVTLEEAIQHEREALTLFSAIGHHMDTSDLRANALRAWVKDFIAAGTQHGITLLFESFGFKHGLPLDADLVFDVRCLPNPHYDPLLRPQTGRDAEVINFLAAEPDVCRMEEDIRQFVGAWLPAYKRDNRMYLTVAIGCTGGQHRSVYLAEKLAGYFRGQANVLVRHRTLAE